MKRRWRIALWAKIFFFSPAYGSTSVGVVIVNEVSIHFLAFLTSDSNISSLLPFLPPPLSSHCSLDLTLCLCVSVCIFFNSSKCCVYSHVYHHTWLFMWVLVHKLKPKLVQQVLLPTESSLIRFYVF